MRTALFTGISRSCNKLQRPVSVDGRCKVRRVLTRKWFVFLFTKFCTSTQNAVFLQHAYILFYSTRCVLNTRLIQWSWCVMIQKRSNTSQCALARRFWTKQSLTHARSFVAKVRRFSAILETFNYHIPLSSGWFDFYLSWEINIWHNMVTQSEFSAAKSTHLSIYNSLNERPARVSFIIAHAGMARWVDIWNPVEQVFTTCNSREQVGCQTQKTMQVWKTLLRKLLNALWRRCIHTKLNSCTSLRHQSVFDSIFAKLMQMKRKM